MIDEKKLIELCKDLKEKETGAFTKGYNKALQDIISTVKSNSFPKVGEWIPFTQRKLTTEEKEEIETEFDYILDCKLPDDDTEILVSSRFGHVFVDTFFNDGGECYLDSGYDFIEDAVAWMPKPEPYKTKEIK